MLKNKKVIIFDLDGTLIDSVGVWNKIDEELINKIRKVEFDNIDIGKQRDTKLKEYRNLEDSYLAYCEFLKEKYKSDMPKEEIKKLRYEIADMYLKEVVDYKPNAEKILKYLKQKEYTLCIASTTGENAIEKYKNYNKNIINKAPFQEIFTLIYSKGAVKNIKPDSEVHYKILKELNVQKEECIIVEDSLIGVEAAKNSGIEVITIYDKYSDSDREEIDSLSDYKFKDFKEMLEYIKHEIEKKA